MQVLLRVPLIWFRDIFKIVDKNHRCRRIAPSVSWETASRVHEEMDWGASGNGAVRSIGQGSLGKFLETND